MLLCFGQFRLDNVMLEQLLDPIHHEHQQGRAAAQTRSIDRLQAQNLVVSVALRQRVKPLKRVGARQAIEDQDQERQRHSETHALVHVPNRVGRAYQAVAHAARQRRLETGAVPTSVMTQNR